MDAATEVFLFFPLQYLQSCLSASQISVSEEPFHERRDAKTGVIVLNLTVRRFRPR